MSDTIREHCYSDVVFGLDARAARVTWTVFLIALLLLTLWVVRDAILLFIVALFLAYMLFPVVRIVHRRAGTRMSWSAAVAITFTTLTAVVILLGVWLGGQIAQQAQSLAQQLPELVKKTSNVDALPVPVWLEPYKQSIVDFLREQTSSGSERVIPLLQHALGGMRGVVGSFVYLVILPILAFLFLKDGTELRDYVIGWVPPKNREFAAGVLEDVHKLLAQYIRALAFLSLASAIAYALFLEITGMQYALLLAMMAGMLEFIPYAGPALAALVVFVVGLFTGYPHVLWVPVFYVVFRLVQDYVIQPQLMSAGIELHPLAVLFGAFAGEAVGGLWGVFLSVPVIAALRILLVRLVKYRTVPEELSAPDKAPSET